MNLMPDKTKTNPTQHILTWLWYWLPPLIGMGIIFYLSHQPDLPHAPAYWLDAVLKKLAHVSEYAILFLLFCRAWRRGRAAGLVLRRSLLTTAAYAISDELHQAWVPGRHANGYDVLIDLSGVLLLWWLMQSRHWRRLFHGKDKYLAE